MYLKYLYSDIFNCFLNIIVDKYYYIPHLLLIHICYFLSCLIYFLLSYREKQAHTHRRHDYFVNYIISFISMLGLPSEDEEFIQKSSELNLQQSNPLIDNRMFLLSRETFLKRIIKDWIMRNNIFIDKIDILIKIFRKLSNVSADNVLLQKEMVKKLYFIKQNKIKYYEFLLLSTCNP